MHSVFETSTVRALRDRIERLTSSTSPQWGKMTVDQMLAHCNVAYDMVYTGDYPKAGPIKRWLLKALVKQGVVGPKPYPRNSPTAPAFRIRARKDFATEQRKLLAYLERVRIDGASGFEGRESVSFGALTASEWDVLFYKHLDHHLTQFGV
jgi:hypothetical protein